MKRLACILAFFVLAVMSRVGTARAAGGTFPKIQASFELPAVTGNPFDYTSNDVTVVLAGPDQVEIRLPAFFDGGKTWRVRHTPDIAGKYIVKAVLLNGKTVQPEQLTPDHFDVEGQTAPGFVRINPHDGTRFCFSDGQPYYPVGYNLAWHRDGEPSIVDSLALMGKAHVNWSRIWMCAWDGKALDWSLPPGRQPKAGEYGFPAIKEWDQIVDAAASDHIYFQMTLQQHGQYSSHADNNWKLNPWNKANGGWLDNAVQFFSDPKAIALTKIKYRYIIARWGYSPSIMAWELFNEVESTDAFKQDLNAVSRWHSEMAAFIRGQDHYHHLITTSSVTTEPKLWPAMDYYQCHAYPPDLLSAIADLDSEQLPRPFFYGEIGASTFDGDPDPGDTIHRVLWGSLMSQSAGASQYWFWELVEPRHLLNQYTVAQQFIQESKLLEQDDLKPVTVAVETPERGPFQFGPAIGWGKSKNTRFTINPDGTSTGLSGMSAYLQGQNNLKEMFPFAVFDVNYPTNGTFAVRFDQMTAAGAQVELTVDHAKVATVILSNPSQSSRPGFDPHTAVKVDTTVDVPLTAGPHSIRLENLGRDWVRIRSFKLDPYAPQLAALGKANPHFAVLWVCRQDQNGPDTVSGTLSLPGMEQGEYTATWWDTHTGIVVKTDDLHVEGKNPVRFPTPPVKKDIAVWIKPR